MSSVIIIDDDPAPSRRRRRAPAVTDYIELLSDDEDEAEEEEEATPPRKAAARRARKQKADEDAEADYDEDGDRPEKKKQKKPRQPRKAKEPKEKRTNAQGTTVRYAAQPSQAVYQRIQRALPGSGHRMFLISTREIAPAGASGGRAQEFTVLGATGNVYTVKIARQPHCDCPDHQKGNLCKHILFVLLRVLKLSTTNKLLWQKALLTQEVEEILSGQHSQGVDAGIVAEDSVLRAYRAATGQAAPDGTTAAGSSVDGRKAIEGDCPICFNELQEGPEQLVWCKSSCGNNVHKQCFDKWAAAKRAGGQPITCVFCRAPWADASAGGAAAAGADGSSYLNLAQHSHQYEAADTSLEALYGDTAMWINHHQGGYAGRGGTARTWRSGYGRWR